MSGRSINRYLIITRLIKSKNISKLFLKKSWERIGMAIYMESFVMERNGMFGINIITFLVRQTRRSHANTTPRD
jgi:hypothetical protein